MKKKIIVTESQLKKYIERKKAELTFSSIINDFHRSSKYLNEDISLKNFKETIIEDYKRKKLIDNEVERLLREYNIIDEKGEII